MSHISDELPRLLTGDATHDIVMQAAEHLRTCPDCQQELVSAVVAHASLTSARRFAPEVVSPPHDAPVASVRPISGAHAVDDESADDSESLPDMSDVFGRARDEAALASSATVRRYRTRRGLLAVAAAAVVLAGGGIALGYGIDGTSSGQQVALSHYDTGHASATATITGDTVTLDASSLPSLTPSQRYEVWLTNAARTSMYSIGFLGDGSSASFKVKHGYLGQYSDIEVSIQPAGQLKYSGTSVLRGSYA